MTDNQVIMWHCPLGYKLRANFLDSLSYLYELGRCTESLKKELTNEIPTQKKSYIIIYC